MDGFTPKGTEVARPFLPAKDFAVSKGFYEALGFTKVLDGQVAIVRMGTSSFILQDYFQKEWAANFMMQLMVDDLDAWRQLGPGGVLHPGRVAHEHQTRVRGEPRQGGQWRRLDMRGRGMSMADGVAVAGILQGAIMALRLLLGPYAPAPLHFHDRCA